MNDPINPGPSKAPLNPNQPPDEDSTFRSQNDVADLRQVVDNGDFDDVSMEPEVDCVRVPALMGKEVYAPSVKIADLINARVPDEHKLILLASFYRLEIDGTRPVLEFGVREQLPLVVFAAASFTEWDEAVPITVRQTHPVLMSYPGTGLRKHLGIGDLPEKGRLGNGLFLIDRPRDDGSRCKFQAVWLAKEADAPHELWHIERTLRILRPEKKP